MSLPTARPFSLSSSNAFKKNEVNHEEHEANSLAKCMMKGINPSFYPTQSSPLKEGNHPKLERGGTPMRHDIAQQLPHCSNRSLKPVYIHQGKQANVMTKGLGSHAFAYKNHIWLGASTPSSLNHTLAHEFAHVLQWQRGASARIRADIFDESLVRQLTPEDFDGINADTIETLMSSLSAYKDNFQEGSDDRLALEENYQVASQVLSERTTSRLEPPPTEEEQRQQRRQRRRERAAMDRDIQRIMNLVQEVHVSDDEEAQILRIIEQYATSTGRFDTFLSALENRHYYGGIFGDFHFRNGIMAVNMELEGRRGRRFHQLLRQKSRRYRNYQQDDEITFSESFWQDVVSGQVRDQIFAYFQGMGEAGVAMAESIISLVRDPVGFLRGLAELPDTIAQFWRRREQIIRRFTSASPTEQARIIGRIFGEAEIFLASMGAGASTTPARGAAATVPLRAEAVVAVGRGSAAMSQGGTMALDLGRLGPLAGSSAQMVAHTSHAGSGNRSAQETTAAAEDATTSSRSSSSSGTPADDARQVEIVEEFADAQSHHRRHDVAPEGTRDIGTTTRPRTSSLTDAEMLAANLELALGTRPLDNHAHHIVPKGMADAEPARAILEAFNIRINAAENGVWLPMDYGVPNISTSAIHSTLHKPGYINWVNETLVQASHFGRRGVLEALSSLRSQINNGHHPIN
nr:AHH domain-containing protein [Grimontia marina]